MASAVRYKFKSSKAPTLLHFDGDFIRVGDVKVLIFEDQKLNYGEKFDLELRDASSGKLYGDESELIARNTSLEVRRVPGMIPGGILSQQSHRRRNERALEDSRLRVRRATGIPSSSLRTVDSATATGTALVTVGGALVRMQPNDDEFARQTAGLLRSRQLQAQLKQRDGSEEEEEEDQGTENTMSLEREKQVQAASKRRDRSDGDKVDQESGRDKSSGEANARSGTLVSTRNEGSAPLTVSGESVNSTHRSRKRQRGVGGPSSSETGGRLDEKTRDLR
mmetsp:Transcript_1955/g.3519  ORF Transcript_1955/g.3519 Transcript_1955/m.3519 type:complete len:279 (-) Transcript_1955:272-1108(-)